MEKNLIMNTNPPKRKKPRLRSKAFHIVNITLLSLFAVVCIYPFLSEILLSFASAQDYMQSNFIVIPKHFNIESYKYILFQDRIGRAFLISIFNTVVGTTINILLTAIGAYALSRKNMMGNKVLFIFILITMFFGGGLIPFYITVRSLGLMNTLWSVLIPFGISSFNMIILRNFFSAVPESVIESCKIDGASQLTVFLRFIIPLSGAGIATVMLFYAVERWNDWYWPMLFITDSELFPMSLELRNILSSRQASGIGGGAVDPSVTFSEGQKAATIVISILPILVVYPFVQKYFVKGVMLGSVKG